MEAFIIPVEDRIDDKQDFQPVVIFGLLLVATLTMWLFAFISLPTDSKSVEWLQRAQLVCFGRTASGLPDAGGWLLLIAAPILFLIVVLIGYGADLVTSASQLSATFFGKCIIAVLVSWLAIQTVWVGFKIVPRLSSPVESVDLLEEFPETYPKRMIAAPEFELINQYGQPIKLSDMKGKVVILTFMFAHCQTMCPLILKAVQEASADISATDIAVVFITLDPWRDTPSALPQMAKSWKLKDGQFALSADPEVVNAVLDSYQIPRTRDDKNGEVVHPALVQVINRSGQIIYTLNNPSAKWLVAAAEKVLAEK